MKNVQTEEEQVLEAVLKAMEFVVHVRLIESYTAHWCWEVDFQLTKVANAATMLAVKTTHVPII